MVDNQEEKKGILTLTQDGLILTETRDDVTMPYDYSFATVNDYIHNISRQYEELECLCLGMANHVDKQSEIIKSQQKEIDELKKMILNK